MEDLMFPRVNRFPAVIGVACLLVFAATAAGAADVLTISHGERVDISAHLAEGKYTLVDFYADWCGPCKVVAPHIDRLVNQHPDRLAVRKIDVGNWREVAAQHRVSSIPHLKLFGPDGMLISEGNAGVVLRDLENRLGGGGGKIGPGSGSSAVPFLIFVMVAAVVSALFFFKGRKPPVQEGFAAPSGSAAAMGSTDASITRDAIWFVMLQGSLEGPFNVEQLEDLKRRRCATDDTQVRRRGDATWRALGDLL